MLPGGPAVTGTRGLKVPAPATRRGRLAAHLSIDLHWAAVAALTGALGGFLVARIDAWPPNEDETLAFFVSGRPIGELLHDVLQERGGAPLHFLLAHLAGLVSPGLTQVRLVSPGGHEACEMGKQEVKRRPAALLDNRLQQLAKRPSRDEERERLVFVGGPGVDSGDQEAPERTGEGRDGRVMKVEGDPLGEAMTTLHRRWHFRVRSADDGRAAW